MATSIFGAVTLILLITLSAGVLGQDFTCSTTSISKALVKDCANAVRVNPGKFQFKCGSFNNPTHPLRTNSALAAAASGHASDMARNNYFSHRSRDGRSFVDRLRNQGYQGSAYAENIARGYNTAFSVISGWMCSNGHRRNLLNCAYDEIGTGVDCDSGRCVIVQLYGCSTRNCCQTGGGGGGPPPGQSQGPPPGQPNPPPPRNTSPSPSPPQGNNQPSPSASPPRNTQPSPSASPPRNTQPSPSGPPPGNTQPSPSAPPTNNQPSPSPQRRRRRYYPRRRRYFYG